MPPKKQKEEDEAEALTRIAIIDDQKCKPKKCAQECMKFCPVVRMGKLCVEVTPSSKIATISEELCIGCGICQTECPVTDSRAVYVTAVGESRSKERRLLLNSRNNDQV